jgi:hypothetical protein
MLALCTLAACSIETSVSALADGELSQLDGGGGSDDARTGMDARRPDSTVPTDAPAPIDSPIVGDDAPLPDTGPLDTGAPDVVVPPPRCDDLFGSIDGYVRCDETATECEFYSNPSSDMTCTELCATASQECRGSWSEGGGGEPLCTRHDDRAGCDDPGDAYLCRCTRDA